MKINGPVRVPPISPITTSKRGRSSPRMTAKATNPDRIMHRWKEKSREAPRRSSMCWKRAELPTAELKHSWRVTRRIMR